MKRKILTFLIFTLLSFTLLGCSNTEDEVEEIIEYTTTLTVSANALLIEDEIVSENQIPDVELLTNLEYFIINEQYTTLSMSVLDSYNQNNESKYLYSTDSEFLQLLYELRNDYYYVFNYTLETNTLMYDILHDEAKMNNYTQFLLLDESIDTIITDEMTDSSEESIETEENETDIEDEDEPEVEDNETETTEDVESDIETDNSDSTDINETEELNEMNNSTGTTTADSYDKYAYILYKIDSVSIYSKDMELLIKDATSAADLSFVVKPEE